MQPEPQKQTARSVARNVMYGSLAWVSMLGLNLIAIPVIVGSLGNHDYGIYALVLGFIAYSFTFNSGRAITKYVAEYRVSGESGKIRDVISASFFLNIAIGACGVTVMCLLAGWLVRTVFGIEPADQEKTIIAMYLASGIIFVTMLSQIFSSVLQGIQRFDVYSKILTVNGLILTSGNLVLAYMGFGLLGLLAWQFLVIVFFCIVFAYASKRLLPEFGISLGVERATLWLVLKYSAAIVGYQILANVLLLFERGWITQKLGTESLTAYVVPMSIGLFLQGFISSLVMVVFPLASELKDEREKLLKLYQKATKIIGLIIVFVVATIAIQSDLFLSLWMGEDFAHRSANLLVFHIICFGLISMMSISWQMTEGIGYPQFNAVTTGICSTIGIVLMLLLTAQHGNAGVAAARLTGFGTIFFSIFVVEKWFFKKVHGRFWLSLGATLGAAALAAGVIEFLVTAYLPRSWPTLIGSVVFGGVVYCLALWVLEFVTADEKILVGRAFSR